MHGMEIAKQYKGIRMRKGERKREWNKKMIKLN